MSGEYRRIEMITATARRRRRTTEHKLRTIEESYGPGEAVLAVARRHDVAASLWYRRRRLMSEGGTLAVCSDETVVGNSGGRPVVEDRESTGTARIFRFHGFEATRPPVGAPGLCTVDAKATTEKMLAPLILCIEGEASDANVLKWRDWRPTDFAADGDQSDRTPDT